MKSYLGLIPIYAKVHKRQNRMTLLCIIISVLLVTTIFSIADMMIRTESTMMMAKHGSWHLQLTNVSQDIGDAISKQPGVTAVGWSVSYNINADAPYTVGDKKAALYGTDTTYMTQLTNSITSGSFPKNDQEVLLTENAKDTLHVQAGDTILLHTPAGDTAFTISGFGSDDSSYYQGQTYLIGVYMTETAFTTLMTENNVTASQVCYVQFQDAAKAAKAIDVLKEQYQLSENDITENTAIMGISGNSQNTAMKNVYSIAAILFLLVLLAGILMISGSMNSNITKRTQFFGMMRCIGASRQQIIRFVRIEALNWCKTAVPIGMILGTLISWGLCALLHEGIGGEFATTPMFAISPIGLASGAIVGIVTVLLAAQSPARRAAKVSPAAAISGSTQNTVPIRHAVKGGFGRIECSLGMHHATASKKNWCLMTASFSLSIILLLCFSVGMDFARALLPSLRSWQPDLTLNGYANAQSLDRSLMTTIEAMPGVSHAYGCSYIADVPTHSPQNTIDHISLVSYDTYMLACAKKSVIAGDIDAIDGSSDKVLTIYNKTNPLKIGDTLQFANTEVTIAGALSDGLFSDDLIVICSQETFDRIMGESMYTLIGIQLNKTATDETVSKISALAADDVIFSDQREANQQNTATYWATRVIGYGFLIIIGMITLFNIINSISMSVSARLKQYGAMRAVGMDSGQLTRMIAAEAFTYAISGLIIGCMAGLLLSRFLYTSLITRYFGNPWTLPVGLMGIIILFVFVSAIAAIYRPVKRIQQMAVTDTINEL